MEDWCASNVTTLNPSNSHETEHAPSNSMAIFLRNSQGMGKSFIPICGICLHLLSIEDNVWLSTRIFLLCAVFTVIHTWYILLPAQFYLTLLVAQKTGSKIRCVAIFLKIVCNFFGGEWAPLILSKSLSSHCLRANEVIQFSLLCEKCSLGNKEDSF